MFIYEISPGTSIEITIRSDNKKLEFHSVAIAGIKSPDKSLVIEPVYIEDKMVNFKAKDIQVSIIINDLNTQNLLGWNRVNISSIKRSDGKMCHVIKSDKEGKKVNRRLNFRVNVGIHGVMMMNFKNVEYDVIIRDISAIGYSFVCDSSLGIEPKTSVVISFYE